MGETKIKLLRWIVRPDPVDLWRIEIDSRIVQEAIEIQRWVKFRIPIRTEAAWECDCTIDAQRLVNRSVQAGDRFRPLGVKGAKKVNRFFMDRKIPRSQRNRIPLIISGGEIVWIAGLEIGDLFALNDQSRQALRLELQMA